MRFFVTPYQIHFDDTMAYGSHHFITNFKFQCFARESFYFKQGPDGIEHWKQEFDKQILLTHEGYCKNLAPANIGEKLAIFMSIGEITRSTVLLCFRTIREDGVPISAGYQRVIVVSRDGSEMLTVPQSMTQFGIIKDSLEDFAGDIAKGGRKLKDVFPASLCRAAGEVARSQRSSGFVEVTENGVTWDPKPVLPGESLGGDGESIAFMFPGQGAISLGALRELYESTPRFRPAFEQADAAARRFLGHSFLALVVGADDAERRAALAACPDLDQIGIFLSGVLSSELLMEEGLQPDLVFGHSFGEITAFAVAGAFDLATGLELVCHRILALRQSGAGSMAAFSCPPERLLPLLAEPAGEGIGIAVCNGAGQTVVSGRTEAVDTFILAAKAAGISGTLLRSRYPFHSSVLEPAREAFANALRALPPGDLRIPVYSPVDGRWYRGSAEPGGILPAHLTKHLDFGAAVTSMAEEGVRLFLECGVGDILTKLVRRNLPRGSGAVAINALDFGEKIDDARSRVRIALSKLVTGQDSPVEADAAGPAGSQTGTRQTMIAEPAAAESEIPETDPADPVSPEPVAIVGAGAVLPRAGNIDTLWRNILASVDGIVDMADIDPYWKIDFAADGVKPDKTYSTKSGHVTDIVPDFQILPYDAHGFARLSRAQRLLAVALSQALRSANMPGSGHGPTGVVLGSTADGYGDTEAAHLRVSIERILGAADVPEADRKAFLDIIDAIPAWTADTGRVSGQYDSCAAVVRDLIGSGIDLLLVDAACASSLYAIDVALRRLRGGDWNTALVGGVYETGPGNQCLFSQFGGLSAQDSRPFDAAADGVIFGEGAAVLVLKRLSDAIQANDKILGVIRGAGLSSDGKSPAVNVPQSDGQELAMRRAYAGSAVPLRTIQYIEAHATATPVGDATEFDAISKAFGEQDRADPIELGSVKALLGHTGWVAGIASVLKVCLAMRAGTVPPQPKLSAVNPKLPLAGRPFALTTRAKPWPASLDGLPRRAAVNGFGFGGTNAHVVLEEFVPEFHAKFVAAHGPAPRTVWAVIGFGALFPDASGGVSDEPVPAGWRFSRSALSLPAGKRLLPDVTESMDASQYLALMAAERALSGIPEWQRFSDGISVVVGMEGRTERGVLANERLYRDRLRRVVAGAIQASGGEGVEARLALLDRVIAGILDRSAPCTPYTLPGVMPNVTTGRVANVFRLRGPNFVVDTGASSFFDAVSTAIRMLDDGESPIVLAGAVNAASTLPAALTASPSNRGAPLGDAAVMLALTTPEMAAKAGFTVLALLDTGTEAAQEVTIPVAHAGAEPVNYRGAQGGAVVAAALRGAAGTKGASAVSWPRPAGEAVWRFLPPRSAEEGNPGPAEPAQQPNSAASGFVTDTPITFHRPELFPAPARPGAFDLRERKILFVTDRPELIAEGAGDLAGLSYAVLAPGTATSDSGAGMSLESDDLLKQSLKLLAPASFDCIVAVTSLAGVSPLALLERPYGEQNDFTGLLFGITRHAYAEIRSGKVPMACLCLGGGSADGRPHPASGLAVGFMKSIIRELPEALCRFIGTTEVGMAAALPQVAAELAQGCPGGLAAEFWYLDGKRHQVKLVTQMAADGQAVPQLTKESVVLVTGGGRGVTAVLVEAILKQWGCTAVLLGRTDLGGVPRHILDMDEATFAAHETEFYREGLAATPGIKIPELKRRYQAHLAARELQGVITRLSALPGRIEYVSGDVTSTDALDMVVAGIADRHGRLDMVIHGAGIQSSKRLPSRRLEEFEAIIGTKLTGLHAIHSACRRHFPARLIDFHLLTSAFSYIGNDGQPDYGAANETMNRLAGWIDGRLGWGRWSTMAWLGWDGIGMTRGSEYSALAAGRRIRGITAPEGEKIFLDFLSKAPPSPVTIPLTEGEIELFGIEIVEAEGASRPGGPGEAGVETITWPISLERHPHFRLHQIRGLPTVPGTFELELAARAARARAPELAVHGFTDCVFHRFVRLRDGEETELRTVSEWLDGDGDEARYRIAVLSDFRHESGVVLQRDVLHIECIVHMTRFPPASLESVVPDLAVRNGTPAPDPYTHPDAPVNHQGLFRHLHDVSLGEGLKEARFILGGDRALDTETEHLTPWLLSDACLSFSMLEINSEGMMPVFVPLRIGSIRFVPGLHDWNIHRLHGEVRLVAPNRPRSRESETREVQTATWVQVVGADDRVLAIVDGAVGRLFKMVPPTMDAGANPDLALA